MCSLKSLPLLPGYVFNRKVGHEKWHKSSQLEWINGKVPYLVEPRRPPVATGYPFPWNPAPGRYDSLYPLKPHSELPSWIINDKQVLSFSAYFHDSTWDDSTGTQVRRVKINYFLEDGTLQVNEEKISNIGGSQGTILSRQRVPFPFPSERAYHSVIDLNVAKSVELFGRVFYIINCDRFTRQWLNRAGIAVPDPVEPPEDEFVKSEQKRRAAMVGKRTTFRPPDHLGQFLKYDRHVLRFYGTWDDRKNEGGDFHNLTLLYYLSDDTIEVREPGHGVLISRRKLPRTLSETPIPGESNEVSLLNVVGGRVAADCLNVGAVPSNHYLDGDLSLGVVINVYGRPLKLIGCDAFTKEFYSVKYGLENFGENYEKNDGSRQRLMPKLPPPKLPPWNGFGGFDDSAGNCLRLVPKNKQPLPIQFCNRPGMDSHILRFRGRLITNDSVDETRSFIISFHLADNSTAIFETAPRNSGFASRMLFGRREAMKPCDDLFVSQKPEIYTKEDFWVGNSLEIDKCKYELLEADEYTLRYMELNPQEFPKSNIDLILMKIRKKLKPVYKSFVCTHLLPDGDGHLIPQKKLTSALLELLGEEITPQEVITVCRHFVVVEPFQRYDKWTLRDICRNECRRLLYMSQDRLVENLRHKDSSGTGYVPKEIIYRLCRGAKVPVDPLLLSAVLEKVDKNEEGNLSIDDLLTFFETREVPLACTPLCQAQEFSQFPKRSPIPISTSCVNITNLLERLMLEDDLKKES